jgi:hypothetical protein
VTFASTNTKSCVYASALFHYARSHDDNGRKLQTQMPYNFFFCRVVSCANKNEQRRVSLIGKFKAKQIRFLRPDLFDNRALRTGSNTIAHTNIVSDKKFFNICRLSTQWAPFSVISVGWVEFLKHQLAEISNI